MVRKVLSARLVLASVVLWLAAGLAVIAQEPGGADPASFFSGTVAALDQGKISVARTILGRSPETRTFLINENTKIAGQLKVKARVTVQFAASDEGDVAVSIVVSDGTPKHPK